MVNLTELIGKKILLLDGAMGTSLQELGLPPGTLPEAWNLSHPDRVESVHSGYLAAGAQIIETNTFGANRVKLSQYDLEGKVKDLNHLGVEIAQTARSKSGKEVWIAGVIGPTGELLEPYGPLKLSQAYQVFREQAEALVEAGADLILIQTMSDLAEARQGVLASKDLGVPVFASVTFEASGRTLTGATPEAAVITLAAAGARVIGANCSLGPLEMVPLVTRMAQLGLAPIMAEPNAGLPELVQGRTSFPQGPVEFARGIERLVQAGAAIIGGCCGTTTEHIRRLGCFKGSRVLGCQRKKGELYVSSRIRACSIGSEQPFRLVGERINPTGRQSLASDISSGSYKKVVSEARDQTQAGADLLDVNVGVAGLDQREAMQRAVEIIQETSHLPLVLDSATVEVLEAGVQAYQGKALLNSVTAKKSSLEAVLPMAKKYGAAVLGLTLTEDGIPKTAKERLRAAETIIDEALSYGLDPEDVIIDCLTMTIGADPQAAKETLEAIRLVKRELGVPTILGVSNISHGLPQRTKINRAFLAMAIGSGLDAGILNPFDEGVKETVAVGDLLLGRDKGAKRYLASYSHTEKSPKVFLENDSDLYTAIVDGDKDKTESLLTQILHTAELDPLLIIEDTITPALEEVGQRYESGQYFLPNLLLSAEAAKKAFSLLKEKLAGDSRPHQGRAVLATVEGDIHDIGKNIVRVILENHGFECIDLGKDVPVPKVVQAAEEEAADIVLLSALMTTTLPAMERTVQRLKEVLPGLPVLVGGAVVTPAYAQQIGASGYGKDAVEAVAEAKRLID